jgi:hypothetical protein
MRAKRNSRGMGRSIRPDSVALVIALAAALLPAAAFLPTASAHAGTQAAAVAGTWGKAQALPGFAALNKSAQAESAGIQSLSCGSPGTCAVGGYYTDSAGHQQAFVAAEVSGTWHQAIEVPGTGALNTGGTAWVESVSCAASGYCAAGGFYTAPGVDSQAFVVTGVDGTWGTAEEVPGTARLNQGGQAQVSTVSCPSAGNCAAGGSYWDAATYGEAFIVREHDGTWHNAEEVPGTGRPPFSSRDPEIDSIACPSAGNCTASGAMDSPQSAFVVDETNGTWHRAELVPRLDALNTGSWAAIPDVSCPTAGNCGAGGVYSDNADSEYHAFAASEVNGTWGKASEITGFSAFHGHDPGILSLSCGSPGNCSAVGNSSTAGPGASYQSANQGFVVSEQDGTWGEPELAPGIPVLAPRRGFVEFNEISCSAPGDCSAAGDYQDYHPDGRTFVIDETDGTWQTARPVPGISALDQGGSASVEAVSCTAPGHCSAGGYFYPKNSQREYLFVVSER